MNVHVVYWMHIEGAECRQPKGEGVVAQSRAVNEEVERHDGTNGIDGRRKIASSEDDRGACDGLSGGRRGGEVAVHECDLVPVTRRAQHVKKVRGEHRVHTLQQTQPCCGGMEWAARGTHGQRSGQAIEVTGKHVATLCVQKGGAAPGGGAGAFPARAGARARAARSSVECYGCAHIYPKRGSTGILLIR